MYWNSHLHFWVWFVSVCYYSVHPAPHTLHPTIIWRIRYTCYCMIWCMGWLCLVGSIKWWVSFAKEPYRRDDILQKRPIILSILLTVATPYQISYIQYCLLWFGTPHTLHPTLNPEPSCMSHIHRVWECPTCVCMCVCVCVCVRVFVRVCVCIFQSCVGWLW